MNTKILAFLKVSDFDVGMDVNIDSVLVRFDSSKKGLPPQEAAKSNRVFALSISQAKTLREKLDGMIQKLETALSKQPPPH